MGFPLGCTDFSFPKSIVYLLKAIQFIQHFVSNVCSRIGMFEVLEPGTAPCVTAVPKMRLMAAVLIRELLPAVKFSELANGWEDPLDSCAVCMCEFVGEDEIRPMTNCRHVFHRSCVDRWIDLGRKTCPVCRSHFVPEDQRENFNERLWIAAGISDVDGE